MLLGESASPVTIFPQLQPSQSPVAPLARRGFGDRRLVQGHGEPGLGSHLPAQPRLHSASAPRSAIKAPAAASVALCLAVASAAGAALRIARRSRRAATRRRGGGRWAAATRLRAAGAGRRSAAEETSDEEPRVQYRQPTPRERQFGYYEEEERKPARRGRQVSVPVSQLHVAAAQRQLPLLLEAVGGDRDGADIVESWVELLEACRLQAPKMLRYWNSGVGPLLRLAAVVPRDEWLRSPSEPWNTTEENRAPLSAEEQILADSEGPEGPSEGAEVLPELRRLLNHVLCEHEAPGTLAAGFTWCDGAGGVLRENSERTLVMCSGVGLEACTRFIRLYAAVGSGKTKPMVAAKELLTPVLTKKMVSNLMTGPGSADFPELTRVMLPDGARFVQDAVVTLAGPLANLRVAQVLALGGSEDLGRALAGGSPLGKRLGTPEEEEFASSVMGWACQFADADEFRGKPSAVNKSVEWLLAQRSSDSDFGLYVGGNPRAPKKVLESAEWATSSLELQRLQTSGERFLSNPANVKGFIKRGVSAAFGTASSKRNWMQVLGLEGAGGRGDREGRGAGEQFVPNSWQGDQYEPCEAEAEFLEDPSVMRKATVRIDEIMSFEFMQHVGQKMVNCLRMEKRGGSSLAKYVSRVRARDSSFWVMTITAEQDEEKGGDEEVQYLLMLEVYNGMKVIHQGEGPHPRRWPRLDAWRWLQEWAAQEGLSPDGPEGLTVGPYGEYTGRKGPWAIERCFLW